jgi:hypothetical protein
LLVLVVLEVEDLVHLDPQMAQILHFLFLQVPLRFLQVLGVVEGDIQLVVLLVVAMVVLVVVLVDTEILAELAAEQEHQDKVTLEDLKMVAAMQVLLQEAEVQGKLVVMADLLMFQDIVKEEME